MKQFRLFFLFVFPLFAWAISSSCLRAVDPLAQSFHRIRARGSLTGTIMGPKGPMPIKGESSVEYDERILDRSVQGEPVRTVRHYTKAKLIREQGDQVGEGLIRPILNPIVILRQGSTEVPFSPRGPMTLGEVDLLRTDVFVGALQGLLPPPGSLPGATWKATESAIRELTDLESIARGGLDCTLENVPGGQPQRVSFKGTVEGVQEEGLARHDLTGSIELGPDGSFRVLDLQAIQVLQGPGGAEKGRMAGRFAIERVPTGVTAELSDGALAGLKLQPDETNTRLQVEIPETGLGFTMSRRWKIAVQEKNQVRFSLPGGAEMLLTLEGPTTDGMGRLPPIGDIIAEGTSQLQKQGHKPGPSPQPSQKTGPRQTALEATSIDVRKSDGTQERWVYAIAKTTNQGAGGILAGRFPQVSWPLMETELAELERLAFSLYRLPAK